MARVLCRRARAGRVRRARRRGARGAQGARPGRLRAREGGAGPPSRRSRCRGCVAAAGGGRARAGRRRDRRRRSVRARSASSRVARHRLRPDARAACTGRVGRRRRGGHGRLRMLDVPADVRVERHKDVPARIALSGVKTCDGRRYFERGEVLIAPRDAASRPAARRPTCERPVEAARDVSGGGRDGRTAGRASGRSARRTSGRPTRRRTASARGRGRPGRPGRRPPRRACSCPSTPGRRASARRGRAGRLPSAALTGPVSQLLVAVAGATIARRLGGRASAAGRTAGRSGSCGPPAPGYEETPNALPGVRLVTCWPRLGAGCLRPVTLPSQVIWCSCSDRPGSALASRPALGQPRAEAGREAGERGGRERRQAGHVDRDAGRVQQRARHLQALQALGREPVRDDRDHGAAGLDAGGQRLEQQAGLLGRGRLGHGVDAPFGADEALGLESEGDDHRRRARRRRRREAPARGWTQSWRNALPPERAQGHNRADGIASEHSDARSAGTMWKTKWKS